MGGSSGSSATGNVSGGSGCVSGGVGIVVGGRGTVAGGSGCVVVVVVVEVVVVEEVVEVVVVSGIVVVVVLVVVVVDSPLVVNASSGTIDHPSLLMFQASIRQDEPPFSYINRFRLASPALMSICPDSIQVQP
jgi:hypothetical protein